MITSMELLAISVRFSIKPSVGKEAWTMQTLQELYIGCRIPKCGGVVIDMLSGLL
jgi:hypothetical protein